MKVVAKTSAICVVQTAGKDKSGIFFCCPPGSGAWVARSVPAHRPVRIIPAITNVLPRAESNLEVAHPASIYRASLARGVGDVVQGSVSTYSSSVGCSLKFQLESNIVNKIASGKKQNPTT